MDLFPFYPKSCREANLFHSAWRETTRPDIRGVRPGRFFVEAGSGIARDALMTIGDREGFPVLGEDHHCLEEIAVNVQAESAPLELSEAPGDREPQARTLGGPGIVSPDKTLHKLLCWEV